MKDKEEIFKLLRESVETPQESLAVEEMIQKIEGNLPPIESVSDTKKIFKGYSFYKNKKGRFTCTISLHRFLWMYLNGEIPEGYDVHHKDFNKDNNSIENLQLITKEEHTKIHLAHKIKKKPDKKMKFICQICGNEYESVNRGNNTYCSQTCKKIAERNRESKLGSVGKLKVNNRRSEQNEIEKAKSQFVVTSGDVAIILDSLKKSLDDITLFIQF